jgi:transposase
MLWLCLVAMPRRDTDVVDAIFYIAPAGCQWRMLPKEFPPFTTVQGYFYQWRDEGRRATINHAILMGAREAAGRETSPTAGVPGLRRGRRDSQSVKTTEAGGPCGYDAAKKVKGRKRHIITDTGGLLVAAQVIAPIIQDRDGAVPLLTSIRPLFVWPRHVFTDSAYVGEKLTAPLASRGKWTI